MIEEGVFILEEQDTIEELIELDSRAFEINSKRKKQLIDITSQYKKEEENIIAEYKKQIEDETREVAQRILQEAQQEIEQMRIKNREALEGMELDFEKSSKEITEEIMRKIFQSNNTYNHG